MIWTQVLAQDNQLASQGQSLQNSYQLPDSEHFSFRVVIWILILILITIKTYLALFSWTVEQEVIDLFDKTATTKNKDDFCFWYSEIYLLMMELIEIKELEPVSTEILVVYSKVEHSKVEQSRIVQLKTCKVHFSSHAFFFW